MSYAFITFGYVLTYRYLLPDKAKHSKQKTKVIKKNLNPQWHETFVFEDVELEELQERCLEITVWDHDNLSSNDFLGGLRLGNGTGELGKILIVISID